MSDFDALGADDKRRHAPHTERNRDVILNVLRKYLINSGTILELASGTGEHAAYMAPHFPDYDWQPSDYDEDNHASINAWRENGDAPNLLPSMLLDIMDSRWPIEEIPPAKPVTAVLAMNILHIAPWEVTLGILDGTANLLPPGGMLYFYGPFTVGGKHTSDSNIQFDASLRERDASWGVRDMHMVSDIARSYGFVGPETTQMPANNFSLVFKKL